MKAWICLLVVVFLATSCSTETALELSRQQRNRKSDTETMSASVFREITAKTPVSSYEQLSDLLNHVGGTLLVNKDFGYDWTFFLLSSDTPNAFSLPSGQVVLFDSLYRYVNNEAELAAVVAHVMSHVIEHHGTERMSWARHRQMQGLSLATALGQVQANQRDFFMVSHTGFSMIGYPCPFVVEHENAADRLALLMMAQAGYDPRCALGFWQRLSTIKQAKNSCNFMSLHPSNGKRIEYLKTVLPEAMDLYNVSRRIGSGIKLAH